MPAISIFWPRALADKGARVIALNMVGRGTSSWLADPMGYVVPNYVGHVLQFLKEQRLDSVDWVGTSMGGLIGMLIAAAENNPIRRLVLNDIGPFISQAALAQLKTYVGRDPHFASLEEAEAYLREIHAGFGPLTDAQWRHLASHSVREADGGLRLHYDPAIKVPYAQMADADVDLWALWEKIRCPTFLLARQREPIAHRRNGLAHDDDRAESDARDDCRRRPCASPDGGRSDCAHRRLAAAQFNQGLTPVRDAAWRLLLVDTLESNCTHPGNGKTKHQRSPGTSASAGFASNRNSRAARPASGNRCGARPFGDSV